jgi:hypothetical protein
MNEELKAAGITTSDQYHAAIMAGTLTQWHAGDYRVRTTLTPFWPELEKTITVERRDKHRSPDGRLVSVVVCEVMIDGERYVATGELRDATALAFEHAKRDATNILRSSYAARIAGG